MANKKITELDAATSLASTDVVPVVDVSEDVTKKITATNLFRTLPDGTAAAPALAFSSDQANGVYLAGTDTVGISTGGTQRFTVDGSGNVSISGDLTVSGATTTVESTTVTIDDKNIELGSVASPSNTTADGGGITLKGATDKTIKWINSTGYWTFNTGIEVGGHIQLDDSNKAIFGTGGDLEILHNGTESFITNITGDLTILNHNDDKDILIKTDNGSGGTNTYVLCDGSTGNVRLYHYGTEKFKTKSDGVDVTGEVQCDSLDVDGTVDITGDIQTYGHLDLRDTKQLKLGNSDDLKLYHDGSHSVIEQSGTGHLYIRNKNDDQHIFLQTDNGSGDITSYVKCDGADGAVKLYHYGNEKLNTTSTGIDVTGEVQCDSLDVDGALDIDGGQIYYDAANNNLHFIDNVKARFGTGSDLRIYHDGSNSYIDDAGTGVLNIRSNDLRLGKYTGELGLQIIADGETRLHYDNSVKLATKTGGIDVTGEVQCDSLDVDGVADITGTVSLHGTLDLQDNDRIKVGADDDLQIWHDGSNSIIREIGTGALTIQSNGGEIAIYDFANSQNMGRFITAGAVELYYNGNKKLETKSDGIDVTGEVQCDSLDVDGGFNIDGSQITYDATSNIMKFADNAQLRFGSGNDLRFYHNGTNNQVDNYTGKLFINQYVDNEDIILRSDDGSGGIANYIECDGASGEVKLSHYGSTKLETKSGGINVHGQVESDGILSVTGNAGFSTFVHAAGQGGVRLTGTGASSSANLVFSNNYNNTITDEYTIQMDGASDALLFKNGGTGAGTVMELDSSGRLLLGTSTEGYPDADNFTLSDSGHCGITIRSGTTSAGAIYFSDGTSGNAEYKGYIDYHQNSDFLRFGTAAVERLRILSTGAWAIEGASNYGTSGQVLTSNGNDAPSWQDAGSVAVGGASAISMNDNVKINFGNSNDLQIYHDGSNSRINNNNLGSLVIKNEVNDADIVLSSDNGSGSTTTYVRCDGSSGEVQLNHYGSQKFRTKSDGVDITGELQCDSLDVDGAGDISGQLTIHSNLNVGGELGLMGTSDSSKYLDVRLGSNTFNIRGTSGGDANHETLATFTRNGPVKLFYDNSQKFQTKTDGIDVTGEVQCDSLDVDGSSNFSGVPVFQSNVGIGNTTVGNSFANGKALALGDNDTGIRQNGDGVLELWSNNAQCFRVRNTGNLSYKTLSPNSNNSLDLGTSSLRWRNVYTNDLNLSNEGSANDVDGTWGNYTIQEGEDDLFLINRRNGKKYKFNLTEVS